MLTVSQIIKVYFVLTFDALVGGEVGRLKALATTRWFIWKYVTISDSIVFKPFREAVPALLQKLAANSFARIETFSPGTVRNGK